MKIKLRKEEISRITERMSKNELFTDAEKLLYQTSLELEKLGSHELLTEASINLHKAKNKIATYFVKHSVACENYIFHYSIIEEPNEGDFILAFDAICIHFGQVNGETLLFDECWSVSDKNNEHRFLTKSASRKILGLELRGVELSKSLETYPYLKIISPLTDAEFINSLNKLNNI